MHWESCQESALSSRSTGLRPVGSRWIGLAVALPCWAMLLIACCLKPAASGQGTHQQLGLTACSSMAYTGYPCPSCGMTTSVAAMAHGQLGLAVHAQPFGVVLFLAAVIFGGLGTVQFCSARPVLKRLHANVWWALAGVGGLMAGWLWKLLAGIAAGQYPLR